MPRWPNSLPPETGRLEEPKFVHGFDPLQHHWKPPERPSPWARHFELGRQHPAVWDPVTRGFDGGWMLVSEVKKGGCRERLAKINADKMRIIKYTERKWPLERWQLRIVTVSDTWCDRELYMRFLGTFTPEEYEVDLKRRRERYEAIQGRAAENKARRAQEAREKAAREEIAARAQIRGRRKPGG